jgi:hypothetical protein
MHRDSFGAGRTPARQLDLDVDAELRCTCNLHCTHGAHCVAAKDFFIFFLFD